MEEQPEDPPEDTETSLERWDSEAPRPALGQASGPGFERSALFGGCGSVRIWDLLGTQLAPPFSAVLSCELEAGGRVGDHVQQRDSEIVIGLEGNGVVWVNGEKRELPPGAVAYLPYGSVLALANPGTQPFRYLIIKGQGK